MPFSEVLAGHGFRETAQPLQAQRFPWDAEVDQLPPEAIQYFYEKPDQVVNIAIDR